MADSGPKPIEPKVVDYCPHCSFPVEYCEFSKCWPKCAVNLKEKHPELFKKFKAAKDAKDAAAKAKLQAANPEGTTTTENAEATPKKEGEDDDKDEDDSDEDDELTFTEVTPSQSTGKQEITIQVNERTKRKRVTIVNGVESFGISSKDIAKQFAKKFATSASAGDEGIVLNGDLLYDIADFLLDQYPNIPKTALIRIEKGGIRKKIF